MYAKHNSESNSTHVEMLKLCSQAMNNEEEHNTFIGVKKQQISGSSTMEYFLENCLSTPRYPRLLALGD